MDRRKKIPESRGQLILSLLERTNGTEVEGKEHAVLDVNNITLPEHFFDYEKMEVDDDLLLQAAEHTVAAIEEQNYFDFADENEEIPNEEDENIGGVAQKNIDSEVDNIELNNLIESVTDTTGDKFVLVSDDITEGIPDDQTNVERQKVIALLLNNLIERIVDDHSNNLNRNANRDIFHNPNTAEGKRSRKPNTNKWNRVANKEKRKRGEEYVGIKKVDDKWEYNVVKLAKKMKKHCDCSMSKVSQKINCDLFTEVNRQELFNQFWKTMDWDQRRTHIQALVDSDTTKNLKNKLNDVSRRNSTLFYHLKLNGQRLRVCKTLFLNTYGITDWVVLSWLKKLEDISLPDVLNNCAEAKTKKRKSEKNEEKILVLKEFLASLPKVESHYCRKYSKKLYLEPIFQTKKQVYDIYKENCKDLNKDSLSIKTFHEEFDSQNLSIYMPRKDQCDLCSSHRAGNVSEEMYETHLLRKELARNTKNEDNNSENHVLTVDKQAILLAPSLKASALYYKSKLVVHNYTVFNNKTKDVVCYVWHEGEGGVTSNEFASIITHHIENKLKPLPTETVIIWSDGCCYQNRNSNLTNSLLLLCEKTKIVVIQKYLEHGHTQMECDSIHAQIERKLKNREIYVPANYIDIMRSSRINPNPYEVEYLDHSFFKDFSNSVVYTSIRPGLKAGDSTVTDICALKYTPDRTVFYKLSFDEEWTMLVKRKRKNNCFENPQQLYKESLKIKPHKYQHLQELKSVIPKDFHSFYDSLRQ